MTITDEMVERAKRFHDEAAALVNRGPLPVAIVRGMLEVALSDDVICPQCRGERRIRGKLCPRCNGAAQIPRASLRQGEEAPFEAALSGKEE